MTALVCYTHVHPHAAAENWSRIADETFDARSHSRFYYLALGLQASLLAYMVSSFFLSVAYLWYVYYLVGYAVCLRRIYESETGKVVVIETRKERKAETRCCLRSMTAEPQRHELRFAGRDSFLVERRGAGLHLCRLSFAARSDQHAASERSSTRRS